MKQWHSAMQILFASSFKTTVVMMEVGSTTTTGLVYIVSPHAGNSAIVKHCTEKFLVRMKPQNSAVQILSALSFMTLMVTVMAGAIARVPYEQSTVWIWIPLNVRVLATPSWRGTVPEKNFLYNKLGHFALIICCAHSDQIQLHTSHFMPHGGIQIALFCVISIMMHERYHLHGFCIILIFH